MNHTRRTGSPQQGENDGDSERTKVDRGDAVRSLPASRIAISEDGGVVELHVRTTEKDVVFGASLARKGVA